MSRYRHVDAMKAAGFPVRAACKAAAISASSYYEWKARGPSAATLANNELLGEITGDLHRLGRELPDAPASQESCAAAVVTSTTSASNA